MAVGGETIASSNTAVLRGFIGASLGIHDGSPFPATSYGLASAVLEVGCRDASPSPGRGQWTRGPECGATRGSRAKPTHLRASSVRPGMLISAPERVRTHTCPDFCTQPHPAADASVWGGDGGERGPTLGHLGNANRTNDPCTRVCSRKKHYPRLRYGCTLTPGSVPPDAPRTAPGRGDHRVRDARCAQLTKGNFVAPSNAPKAVRARSPGSPAESDKSEPPGGCRWRRPSIVRRALLRADRGVRAVLSKHTERLWHGFVVVQHLDGPRQHPHRDSAAQYRHAGRGGAGPDGVLPNRVYVIPPNRDMAIFHGALNSASRTASRASHAIDSFLRSLAEDQGAGDGNHPSGTGTDGTPGCAPSTAPAACRSCRADHAKFDGMPSSAIQAGFATHVLPVEKMPEVIWPGPAHRPCGGTASGDGCRAESHPDGASLHHRSRLLAHKKSHRPPPERRMAQHDIADMELYARFIGEQPARPTLYSGNC